jgi:hypothetical protein
LGFAAIEAAKAFVGEDCEAAYLPAAARAVLRRFDARSQHYKAKIARSSAAR